MEEKIGGTSYKPWGYYVILADMPDHKVKRIHVCPGQRLSLQRHKYRSEHWHIVSGEALATLNGNEVILKPGDSIDIPQRSIHRIENIGDDEVYFIEIQSGEYFGEDDIERLEDDFGRA